MVVVALYPLMAKRELALQVVEQSFMKRGIGTGNRCLVVGDQAILELNGQRKRRIIGEGFALEAFGIGQGRTGRQRALLSGGVPELFRERALSALEVADLESGGGGECTLEPDVVELEVLFQASMFILLYAGPSN